MLRHSFILLLIISSLQASSQPGIVSYQSFVIDNKEVVWVQVYHFEDSLQKITTRLFEHLKRKYWITGIGYDGTDIVADLISYRPDYKRYGGKFMNTSMIIRTGRWTGKVRIGFKDGKYRVVLYGLNYLALQSSTGSGKATMEAHEITGTLTEFVLTSYRTGFKKNRLKNLDMLHLSFKDSFTLTVDQVIGSDW
jgi:hypothetical protein